MTLIAAAAPFRRRRFFAFRPVAYNPQRLFQEPFDIAQVFTFGRIAECDGNAAGSRPGSASDAMDLTFRFVW